MDRGFVVAWARLFFFCIIVCVRTYEGTHHSIHVEVRQPPGVSSFTMWDLGIELRLSVLHQAPLSAEPAHLLQHGIQCQVKLICLFFSLLQSFFSFINYNKTIF